MDYQDMAREQLLEDLAALRRRVAALEANQNDQKEPGDRDLEDCEARSELARDELLLSQIGQIISSTLEIDEVYARFAQEVGKVVAFDRMSINTIDQEAGVFTIKYLAGQEVAERHIGAVRQISGSQTEHLLETGHTVIREDLIRSPVFPTDPAFIGEGLRSSIMVPLISKGKITGSLSLRSRSVGTYGDREQAVLERLAQQIAPAIENAELYQRTRRTEEALRRSQEAERRLAQENAVLAETGRIISSTLNIDEVYERFCQETRKLLDFDRMSINIISREAGFFTFRYVSGPVQPGRAVPDVIPLPGTQTEYVIKTGQTLVRADVASDPRFRGDQNLLGSGMRSSMMTPLKSKGGIIGTLSLRSRQVGAYGTREQVLIERLADQIAAAIENAELYTQTRQAEQELRESEHRFRYLVESAADAFVVFNSGGQLVDVNQRACEVLGYKRDELLQLSVWDIRADQTEPTWPQLWENLVPSVPITVERLYRRKDGATFPVENRIGLVELKGERFLFSITRDISERKHAEQVLLDQMRDLAVADERNRLARELHDSVAQSIYSLTLFSETARQLLSTGNEERLEYYLTRLGQTSQQALKEMRLLVHELRPLQLENEGLIGALQHRLDAVEQRAGVDARLLIGGTVELPPNYEYELYRVAQEALNNALKHSAATTVTVRVAADGDGIQMEIHDNGKGFAPDSADSGGGMGLVNMRHRVRELGGELQISSQINQGTTVKIMVRTAAGLVASKPPLAVGAAAPKDEEAASSHL